MKCVNCGGEEIEFTRLEKIAMNSLPILQEQLKDYKEEVVKLRKENIRLRESIAALEREL